jgi:hypothetical protein
MQKDLKKCTTDLERSLCAFYCTKEIIDKSREIIKKRKLTPGEVAVLATI